MRRVRLGLILSFFASLPMFAQTDKFELFGGYSLERTTPGCGSDYSCGTLNPGVTTNFNGWAVAGAGYIHESLEFSAQVTGNYNGAVVRSSAMVSRYTYEFGPAYRFGGEHASGFVHALFGGVTQAQQYDPLLRYTKFAWSAGGGVGLRLSGRMSVRIAQLDYERLRIPVENTGNAIPGSGTIGSNGLRYSAGMS